MWTPARRGTPPPAPNPPPPTPMPSFNDKVSVDVM